MQATKTNLGEETPRVICNKVIPTLGRCALLQIAGMLLLTAVVVPSRLNADAVTDWNQISEKAVKTAGAPPPVAALDFAIVHLAIYDAVESIDQRYEPYHAFVPGATGSLNAAAAKAGPDVL